MSSVAGRELRTDIAGLPQLVGTKIGPTDWTEITQDQVNQFGDLTNDHGFIHVDPERAKETHFGGTIAHGFFSLALLARVGQQLQVSDVATVVNYGLDKVRFPAPLPVNARWRAVGEITEVAEVKGGTQVKLAAALEVQGSERPAVAAECVIRFYA